MRMREENEDDDDETDANYILESDNEKKRKLVPNISKGWIN
jgi:hypothetical protein